MTLDIRLLIYSVILNWVMIMVAGSLRNRLWTPSGILYGVSNRDQAAVDPSTMAGRADRAAKNMLENLLLFATLLLAARVAGVAADKLVFPAQLFFYARLAYFPIYVVGIPYIRTVVWLIGVIGMFLIAREAFSL
jgi:uncharacterized MAPEG superfamily protein